MIEFSQLWNTRWVTGDRATSPSVWDAVDKNNSLQASGLVVSVWSQFLLNQMVGTSSTAMVKSFASYSPTTGALNVFLVNKDTSARDTTVVLPAFSSDGGRWVLRGNGPGDMYPAWTHTTGAGGSNSISLTLEPVSISVMQFVQDHRQTGGSPTLLFSDKFESGGSSNWTPLQGSWSVCRPSPGASLEYCATSTDVSVSLAGSPEWSNYYVQSYVNMSNDAFSGVALLARVKDDSHFYQAEFRRDGSGGKMWTLYKNSGGDWTLLASGSFNYSGNTYYLLRLSVVGTSIQLSVSTDWGATFQNVGAGTDGQYLTGRIGLRSWWTAASFDSVAVCSQPAGVSSQSAC
jgi:hypothetical protein